MDLDQSGFLRSVSLLGEEVPDFGVYPYSIPAIRNLDTLELDPGVTFLVGPNGSGKSTLVEAIAVAAASTPRAEPRASTSRPAPPIRTCTTTSA